MFVYCKTTREGCCYCCPKQEWCCNLTGGVALNVLFTTNGMCVTNNAIYMWCKQAITEWSRHVISIVGCCHSAKLWAHVAWAFRSQQNGSVSRMWRSCHVKLSQNECAMGAVHWKRRGCCCNLTGSVPLNVRFTMNRMCVKNNTVWMWCKQAIIEWLRQCGLSCCVLP